MKASIPQFYVLPPAILTGPAAAMGLAVANSVGSVERVGAPTDGVEAPKDLTRDAG